MITFTEYCHQESLKSSAQGLIAGTILGASVLTSSAHSIIPLPQKFIAGINQVEAHGKHNNIPQGDRGSARGPFQIHKQYWQDAIQYNPELAKGHIYADVDNYDYAVQVVTAYLNRYGKKYIQTNDLDALARIHNAGPNALDPSRKALTNNYVKQFERKTISF